MRGLHPVSFEPIHALAWAGVEPPAGESTGEVYDLVVVGGGLSGLAAVYYYRKQAGPKAKILILGNPQGIGGHAQRNRSDAHTSELPSLMRTSNAVFCLQTKTTPHTTEPARSEQKGTPPHHKHN